MMHSENHQGRVCASGDHFPAHGPSLRKVDRQQRNPSHNEQFAVLAGCKAVTEHATQILDADQLCREYIRHTNWIDELCHEHPSQDMDKRGVCKSSAGVSKAYGAQGVQFVKPLVVRPS